MLFCSSAVLPTVLSLLLLQLPRDGIAQKVETSSVVAEAQNRDAEEARWLVSEAVWGTASFLGQLPSSETGRVKDADSVETAVLSYGITDDGHVYLYLMGAEHDGLQLALTISEASLPPTSNFADAACGLSGNIDAEDPRCAKLTLTGRLRSCPGDKNSFDDACSEGWNALVDKHPSMAYWPQDHGFVVHELQPHDIWMIANFGGGSIVDPQDFRDAEPTHHPAASIGRIGQDTPVRTRAVPEVARGSVTVPDASKKIERARWVVAKSLWATVSTTSVRLNGAAWGNIRSIIDGHSIADSTGKPVFYLPTPDPTNIDVQAGSKIAITMSEASLADRLSAKDQTVCDGRDPEDPLCARVVLYGTAVEVTDTDILAAIMEAFGERHKYAWWLAKGGSHTGGGYYTIELDAVTILDYYGGATPVDVQDYLNWSSPSVDAGDGHRMLRGGH